MVVVVVAAVGSAGATALGCTLAMPPPSSVSLSVCVCCLRLGLIGETETWGIYTGWVRDRVDRVRGRLRTRRRRTASNEHERTQAKDRMIASHVASAAQCQ